MTEIYKFFRAGAMFGSKRLFPLTRFDAFLCDSGMNTLSSSNNVCSEPIDLFIYRITNITIAATEETNP